MYELLDRINGPKDLKELNLKELEQLCGEIRSYMVECCAVTPGHLGASLGAVELIVGYHYMFESPEDKIVFDVGHQAYAHKILTGRREAFKTLRTEGGISGFPAGTRVRTMPSAPATPALRFPQLSALPRRPVCRAARKRSWPS